MMRNTQTRSNLSAMTAVVALLFLGLPAILHATEAVDLKNASIEELEELVWSANGNLMATTQAQQEIERERETLSEIAGDLEIERQDLENRISSLEESYEKFDDGVATYNQKCDRTFSEGDPELSKCLTWQRDLKATEEQLGETQSNLIVDGEQHDLAQKDLSVSRSAVDRRSAEQETELRKYISTIRAIRDELDDRKWFGCADKQLCDNIRRIERCVRVNALACRIDCLTSVREQTPTPACM